MNGYGRMNGGSRDNAWFSKRVFDGSLLVLVLVLVLILVLDLARPFG